MASFLEIRQIADAAEDASIAMRADRMIAILLMMQDRGRVTAPEIADELEVSVRTARRDLEALALAGLPVYSQPGRNGGWQLLGDGRTDLTGLSTSEASALVTILSNLSPLTDGTASHTASAIRKLVGALPESVREPAMRAAASTRFVDGVWERGPTPARFSSRVGTASARSDEVTGDPSRRLGIGADAVRDAILAERRAELVYRDRSGVETTRTIDPLGVVNKGGRWYLVAGTDAGQRTFRLDRIERLSPSDEAVRRPPDFDLDAAWRDVEAAVDAMRRRVSADLAIDQNALRRARFALGERLEVGEAIDEQTVAARLDGWQIEELAALLAGLHPQVRVIGPAELRQRLASLGEQLVADHRTEPR